MGAPDFSAAPRHKGASISPRENTMDKLGIINMALMKAGLPLAASLEDCDWNAAARFDQIVEDALRGFPWGFAQKFETLARSAAMPPHGFRFSYVLPSDCLRMIDIRCAHDLRAPKARYVISRDSLFANVAPCNARFVHAELNPARWTPDFADAVACRLAAEIMSLSGQDMARVPQLMQLWQLSLAQARANDAMERADRVPLDESILAARAGIPVR